MPFEVALRELGDGDRRTQVAVDRRTGRYRVLPRLDAGDDERRPAASLGGRDLSVPAHGDPSRTAVGSGLDDVGPGAGRIDPYPEPEKRAIPEDRVRSFDRETFDGAVGDAHASHARTLRLAPAAVFGHGDLQSPCRDRRRRAARAPLPAPCRGLASGTI